MATHGTHEQLQKRVEKLARKYAESHGEEIKTELSELSRQIAEMKKRLILNGTAETEQVSDLLAQILIPTAISVVC